jgi:hypothetical protein
LDQVNQVTAVQLKAYGGSIETKQTPSNRREDEMQIPRSSHANKTTTTAERGQGPKQNTTTREAPNPSPKIMSVSGAKNEPKN